MLNDVVYVVGIESVSAEQKLGLSFQLPLCSFQDGSSWIDGTGLKQTGCDEASPTVT